MAWPTVAVNTTNMDANADSPLSARPDILDLTTKFNELIAMRAVANGVASLGATGKIPAAQQTIPETVPNFVNGSVIYCSADTPARGFFQSSAYIGAAWESVGPTGSGATNIWTELDIVPATAVALILRIRNAVSGSAIATYYEHSVYARKNGSSATVNEILMISIAAFINRSGSTERDDNITLSIIPVLSPAKFDLYENKVGGGVGDSYISLVGWIDSVH